MALRGDHRHVPAAAADVRGADRRSHPVPLHGVAVGAADHDADRRSPEAPLRGAPRQADRARPRRRSSAPSPSRTTSGSRTCTTIASSRCATPGAATTATWCARSAGCRRPGRVEVITSTATHAFFPLMDRNWAAIRAQVHVAADLYERHFGSRPRGMWLGECGFVPGVDELLREAAVRYFFVDTHGILFADRRPVHGVYAPLYCPSGVAAFGRDMESSEQVWSAKEGYPGDRALPRLLPRHRLRPAARLHRAVHPPRRPPRVHGHQVPRDHARPAARQVGLRPGHRARQGGPARVALPRQPREAGAAPARRTWIGRRSS